MKKKKINTELKNKNFQFILFKNVFLKSQIFVLWFFDTWWNMQLIWLLFIPFNTSWHSFLNRIFEIILIFVLLNCVFIIIRKVFLLNRVESFNNVSQFLRTIGRLYSLCFISSFTFSYLFVIIFSTVPKLVVTVNTIKINTILIWIIHLCKALLLIILVIWDTLTISRIAWVVWFLLFAHDIW